MYKANKSQAPRRERDGLASHILLQAGDVAGTGLAVTWVEVAPGAAQRPHAHQPEQVYVLVRGRGRMHVGDEVQEVQEGDLVYIPPYARHSIENMGGDTLTYISAATPPIDLQGLYDGGELKERD